MDTSTSPPSNGDPQQPEEETPYKSAYQPSPDKVTATAADSIGTMLSDGRAQFKKFTRGYTFKMLFLASLILLMLIPLSMVSELIRDRSSRADSAEAEVLHAWGGELAAAGPVVVIPGIKTEVTQVVPATPDGAKVQITKKHFTLVVAPQKLNLGADFKTEVRRRGIFSVPLFYGDLSLSGTFDFAQAMASIEPRDTLLLDKAELVVILSSQKGIRKIGKARWNTKDTSAALYFQPGNREQNYLRDIASASLNSKHSYSGRRGRDRDASVYDNISGRGGIYAELPELAASAKVDFDISITIHGGRLVRFLPFGQDTHAEINADWPSPSYQGSFLPGSASLGDNGFNAEWDISYLSREIPLYWRWYQNKDDDFSSALFGVNFFRAIDTYSLNNRAVKYAILFIIVPFLTLFLFEIFTKKKIHPVPYLLCGIANIIFYLLLLSLSEQVAFYLAYIIAAAAIVTMLTLYSRTLLPSWRKSWYMGLVLTVTYVLLYAVLNAESYALLVGSVFAFIVVGMVMFVTRKLNWYGSDD